MTPRVVLVTVDGFSVDVLGDSPVLAGLADVSRSWWAHGFAVSPTLTYANHASLYTGAGPDQHGVPMNDAFCDGAVVNTSTGYLRAPTLLGAARAAGRRVAAVLGDQHVARLLLNDGRDGSVWPPTGTHVDVETDGMGDTFDRHVVEECLRVLSSDEPDLLVVHLNDTDTAGHVVTPRGDLAVEWRARTDAEVGRLVDALRGSPRWVETTLVVVSDHDMLSVDTDAPILLQQALDTSGVVPIGNAHVVDEGGVAGVWLEDPAAAEDIVAVASALPGVAGAHRVTGEGRARLGDVVVHADASHAFAADETVFRNRGIHGQPAAERTLAIVTGGDERLRADRTATQLPPELWPRAIDWAPTVAHLLDIPVPAASVGRVLREALAGD